jgi:hypothetical protein
MKNCCVCKLRKPLTSFGSHQGRKDGKQTYCKSCSKQEQTRWYYKRKYGITLEQRDALLKAQNDICAICNTPIIFDDGTRGSRTGESACLDHCHGEGHIRGVLCGHCNTGLGAFKDNVAALSIAISYLLKNK